MDQDTLKLITEKLPGDPGPSLQITILSLSSEDRYEMGANLNKQRDAVLEQRQSQVDVLIGAK